MLFLKQRLPCRFPNASIDYTKSGRDLEEGKQWYPQTSLQQDQSERTLPSHAREHDRPHRALSVLLLKGTRSGTMCSWSWSWSAMGDRTKLPILAVRFSLWRGPVPLWQSGLAGRRSAGVFLSPPRLNVWILMDTRTMRRLVAGFNAPTAGLYKVSVAIAAQQFYDMQNSEAGLFSILVDGTTVANDELGVINPSQILRGSLSGAVTLSAGPHNFQLMITRPWLSSTNTPDQYVDNLSLSSAVPEPATLTLLGWHCWGLVSFTAAAWNEDDAATLVLWPALPASAASAQADVFNSIPGFGGEGITQSPLSCRSLRPTCHLSVRLCMCCRNRSPSLHSSHRRPRLSSRKLA